MKRVSTKETIIATALELFNEKGSAAVSTNHIADALGISTGNLYYHFKNKEEIIRAIFLNMVGEMDTAWVIGDESSPTLDDFFNAMTAIQEMLINYRFFQRELSTLVFNDPELAEINKAVRAARFKEIETFFDHLIKSGAIRKPEDEHTLLCLIRTGWLIGDYWLDYLSIEGSALNKKNIGEGVDLIREIIRPYLVESA